MMIGRPMAKATTNKIGVGDLTIDPLMAVY
jgi:hypothetical protein